MNILEVKGLSFSYTDDSKTLDDVSFSVKKGDYVAIAGPNGCGKSTTARIIAGLLDPTVGTITIDGLSYTNQNMALIRPLIGIVFQNPDNQFIGTTVRDDIAFGLENHNLQSGEMSQIIQKFAKTTGVDSLLDKEPDMLSGGQKQRAALAGVLAMKPSLLILDEATSMLDPAGRDKMRALFKKLNKEDSLTVISITHDPQEMLEADSLIVMNKGRIVFNDQPSKVFEHRDELVRMGLGLPFIYEIKEALKKNNIEVGKDLNTEEEIVRWLLNSTK